MFDPFKKLKLAGAFLGVGDEAAAAGPESLDISELFGQLSVKDLRSMTLPAERLLEQPGVRALYESRYLPEPEPLGRLTALGEGTLGCEYARYLRHHNLSQPTPSRRIDLGDPAVYLAERVRMTHPLLHLITEYDASPLGELALQAYYIGQTGSLISGVILSSALLQITRDAPESLGDALEVTAEAFQRGKIARSFLGIAWEELWSAQVPQLRELVEIPTRSSAVALLRFNAPPAPEPRASRSGNFSSFADAEDGFAALGRAKNISQPHQSSATSPATSPATSSTSSARNSNNTPPPRPRNFTGFGGAPLKPEPDPPPRPVTPAHSEPAPREPASPEPRARTSSSSLLASFMALAEQAARPEPPPPAPPPAPLKPPPPPRVEARPAARPPAPPPPVVPVMPVMPVMPVRPGMPATPATPGMPVAPARTAAPAAPARPGEPAYKIEETAKNITPALSPDDPDYF